MKRSFFENRHLLRHQVQQAKALNAINPQLISEVHQALMTSKRPFSRVVVLTGEGDKAFIAERTFLHGEPSAPGSQKMVRAGHDLGFRLENFPSRSFRA